MTFGHEQLDVYRAAIESVGWASCRSDAESDSDPDADSDSDSDRLVG
jgi:hypothetical protein